MGAFGVTKQCGGAGVVRLLVSGDVDHDVSDALTTIIINALDHEPVREIVLDLQQVTFLAAAGMRTFLEGRAAAAAQGASLRLVNAHGPVELVLTTLGWEVHPVIPWADSPRPPCRPARADSPSDVTAHRPVAGLDRW